MPFNTCSSKKMSRVVPTWENYKTPQPPCLVKVYTLVLQNQTSIDCCYSTPTILKMILGGIPQIPQPPCLLQIFTLTIQVNKNIDCCHLNQSIILIWQGVNRLYPFPSTLSLGSTHLTDARLTLDLHPCSKESKEHRQLLFNTIKFSKCSTGGIAPCFLQIYTLVLHQTQNSIDG